MGKLYTRTGDRGETGLLYGGRVPKTDSRLEAYGTVDEANSTLGLARSLVKRERLKPILLETQQQLFTVGAELATDPQEYDKFKRHFRPVTPEMTARLEQLIDQLEAEAPLPASFVVPGASPGSAALDMARTILRRAERRVVALQQEGRLANEEVLRYLNRLSDLLFMLARYEDQDLPTELVSGQRVS